jgi:hypothetical protein
MVLYKKYILTKQESYSLANISEVELGHTKLDHSEYKTWKEFHGGLPLVDNNKLEDCDRETQKLGRRRFLIQEELRKRATNNKT